MAESAPQASHADIDDRTRGLPHHQQETDKLKRMLEEQKVLARNLELLEDRIFKKETEYLEDTPYGNILTGFDNYIKGSSSSAPGGRRKPVTDDSNRVFSNSSTRWNDMTDSPGLSSSRSTPSHAPTPINTSFLKDMASNTANGTPTSATSANKTGAGIKKAALKTGPKGEDSETDSKDKKARVGFGASRK